VERLLGLGSMERIGRGKFLLARRFYQAAEKAGACTRTKGLDWPQQKGLILPPLRESHRASASPGEFFEVLPGLIRSQLQRLLQKLRCEQQVELRGVLPSGSSGPAVHGGNHNGIQTFNG